MSNCNNTANLSGFCAFLETKLQKNSKIVSGEKRILKYPFPVFGFARSGKADFITIQNRYRLKAIYNRQNIAFSIAENSMEFREIYNSAIDKFTNTTELYNRSGSVGIYSHDMPISIKSFSIYLNTSSPFSGVTSNTVSCFSPAIPVTYGQTVNLKKISVRYTPNSKPISEEKNIWFDQNGNEITKITVTDKKPIKLTVKYKNKSLFVCTVLEDKNGRFPIFNYDFKNLLTDINSGNSPFIIRTFLDSEVIENIELKTNEFMPDFLKFENDHRPFVIFLREGIIPQFSDYTLECELSTEDSGTIPYKRVGFIGRLNLSKQKKSVAKSNYCAATYTRGGGVLLTNSGYKMLNSVTSHTTNESLLEENNPKLGKIPLKNNSRFSATQNDTFFIPANTEYIMENREILDFKYSLFGFKTNLAVMPAAYTKSVFKLQNADKFFKKLLAPKLEPTELVMTFFELNKTSEEKGLSDGLKFFERTDRIIEKTPLCDISVAYIAKELNISRNYFSYALKKEIGQSPQKYIRKKKLETAKRLLLIEGNSVSAVGEMIGYENTASFLQAFKSEFGVTPHKFIIAAHKKEN